MFLIWSLIDNSPYTVPSSLFWFYSTAPTYIADKIVRCMLLTQFETPAYHRCFPFQHMRPFNDHASSFIEMRVVLIRTIHSTLDCSLMHSEVHQRHDLLIRAHKVAVRRYHCLQWQQWGGPVTFQGPSLKRTETTFYRIFQPSRNLQFGLPKFSHWDSKVICRANYMILIVPCVCPVSFAEVYSKQNRSKSNSSTSFHHFWLRATHSI